MNPLPTLLILTLLAACQPPLGDPQPSDTSLPPDTHTPPDILSQDTALPPPDTTPPPQQPPTLRFVDHTTRAGIRHTQWEPSPAWNRIPCTDIEVMTGGAAAADYDDDGDIDLLFTRLDAPLLLYQNDGTGHFTDVAPEAGLDDAFSSNGAAFADIDGDRDLDLIVTAIRHPNRLYLNQGNATFLRAAPEALAPLPGLGPDCIKHRCRCTSMFSASVGDANGDRIPDLHISHWKHDSRLGWRSQLLLGRGDATFRDAARELGAWDEPTADFSSSFIDLDDDGTTELLITADFEASRLLDPPAPGRAYLDVTEHAGIGTDENGMGHALGDIDGDGDLDLFVTAIFDRTHDCSGTFYWGCTGNRLYLNNGDATFTDATNIYRVRFGGWGWGAAFFDVDNDGDLDLGHTAGYDLSLWDLGTLTTESRAYSYDPIRLWLNDGRPPMREAASELGLTDTRSGKAFLPFDADNDGDLDLVITHTGAPPVFYRNTLTPNTHRWLRIQLRGRPPNTQALGARLYARTAPNAPEQRRDIHANASFLGTAPAEAHFGFGPHPGPLHTLRIEWPSGAITELHDIELDRLLVLEEPQRVIEPEPQRP